MKKICTLAALACMAVGASAQGTYALAEGDAPKAGDKITSVDNITLTYGGSGTTYSAAVKSSIEGFGFYTAGEGNNPKDANNSGYKADKQNLPTTGTYYVFTPKKAGTLNVAVVLNANKPLFVTENGAAMSNYNGVTSTAKDASVKSFAVKAGSTYYVFCTGSKLGFAGFSYELANPNDTTTTGGDDDDVSGGGSGQGNPDNPNDQARGLNYTGTDINTIAPTDAVVIWCAPDGNDATADGSEAKPYFDVQNAIDKALPGTTIKMKAGTYKYNKRININDRNGTSEQYITLMCPDGRAVLDFSGMPYHAHANNPEQGMRITSSYWHLYKIDFTNASDNGLLIERNKPTGGTATDIANRTQDAHDNIIEFCNFYRNGDTGLQMKNLAAFNYVLNCDSYENKDEEDGDADGFAPKVSVGGGNYFYGCRAYNNSDDGYDCFYKQEGGFPDNQTLVLENCLAYENGFINGTATKGNMNGFKMGSKEGRMNVVLNRCVAVNNGSKGFDQNHNKGDIIMNNCTGYSLLKFKGSNNPYSYRIYEALASGSVCEATNCIALNDYVNKDASAKGEYGTKNEKTYGRVIVSVASKDVTNNWLVSPTNVQSIDDYETLIGERQADGSLNWDNITWGHPTTDNAVLVDKGTAVEANTRYASAGVAVPAIAYSGAAPDLGAFEQGLIAKKVVFGGKTGTDAIGTIASSQSDGKKVSLVQAFNGMVIVNVNGAKASEKYTINAYDASGALLGQHEFNGTNTSIYLPQAGGLVILKVSGNGVNETVKAVMK